MASLLTFLRFLGVGVGVVEEAAGKSLVEAVRTVSTLWKPAAEEEGGLLAASTTTAQAMAEEEGLKLRPSVVSKPAEEAEEAEVEGRLILKWISAVEDTSTGPRPMWWVSTPVGAGVEVMVEALWKTLWTPLEGVEGVVVAVAAAREVAMDAPLMLSLTRSASEAVSMSAGSRMRPSIHQAEVPASSLTYSGGEAEVAAQAAHLTRLWQSQVEAKAGRLAKSAQVGGSRVPPGW